jgi:NAD(P)H-quinone oxidoreductase subunit 5
MAVHWLVLVSSAALLAAGAIRLREKTMPITPPQAAERTALLGIFLATYSVCHINVFGPTKSPVLGIRQFGFSVLLDAVSVILLRPISILAWVILRFSATHLQGEGREGRFTFWVCFSLAGIVLMVTAGNLVQLGFGWVGTAIGANRLVIFYSDRPGARRAVRKNIVFARAAFLTLAASLLLLYRAYGASDIATINAAARAGFVPPAAVLAAACLAVAAVLQSALIPVHGWLTEVIEAPTPVSALLHADVVSAGGFLLIRFADVMLGVPLIMATLVIVGASRRLLDQSLC